MYIPRHFEEKRLDVLQALIREYPLATLVTLTPDGLSANHIPLHFDDAPLPYGCLRGHVARANPVWQDVSPNVEVLTIFHGPQAYISPSWYPTKQETGKVVPTWNYVVVHAHGLLQVRDDPTWLRSQLEQLTQDSEQRFPEPWRVSDAPLDYTERLLAAIVGIEIVITRLSGKWKVSQNQSEGNREGVREGLRTQNAPQGTPMATLIPDI